MSEPQTQPVPAPAPVQPTVGRIVHYTPDPTIGMFKGHDVCAAIITRVKSDTTVDLTVFAAGHMDNTCLNDVELRDDKKVKNVWSWPPRA